jgi:hypothetical protein
VANTTNSTQIIPGELSATAQNALLPFDISILDFIPTDNVVTFPVAPMPNFVAAEATVTVNWRNQLFQAKLKIIPSTPCGEVPQGQSICNPSTTAAQGTNICTCNPQPPSNQPLPCTNQQCVNTITGTCANQQITAGDGGITSLQCTDNTVGNLTFVGGSSSNEIIQCSKPLTIINCTIVGTFDLTQCPGLTCINLQTIGNAIINVAPGSSLTIHNLDSEGTLIVNGDVIFAGTVRRSLSTQAIVPVPGFIPNINTVGIQVFNGAFNGVNIRHLFDHNAAFILNGGGSYLGQAYFQDNSQFIVQSLAANPQNTLLLDATILTNPGVNQAIGGLFAIRQSTVNTQGTGAKQFRSTVQGASSTRLGRLIGCGQWVRTAFGAFGELQLNFNCPTVPGPRRFFNNAPLNLPNPLVDFQAQSSIEVVNFKGCGQVNEVVCPSVVGQVAVSPQSSVRISTFDGGFVPVVNPQRVYTVLAYANSAIAGVAIAPFQTLVNGQSYIVQLTWEPTQLTARFAANPNVIPNPPPSPSVAAPLAPSPPPSITPVSPPEHDSDSDVAIGVGVGVGVGVPLLLCLLGVIIFALMRRRSDNAAKADPDLIGQYPGDIGAYQGFYDPWAVGGLAGPVTTPINSPAVSPYVLP